MRFILFLVFTLTLLACATVATPSFEALFGPADPTRFDAPKPTPATPSYTQVIQPILDRRCVVCHACYDAPCQLKTTSWEGIARGASKVPVYDATRLFAAPTTRLYEDAQKASQWRTRGFSPVLNEHAVQTPEANRTAGLMYRLLALKQAHPGPSDGLIGKQLDFSIDRAAACPAGPQIEAYEHDAPLAGMPFGLPPLSVAEHESLSRWIENGAPYEGHAPLAPLAAQRVQTWEGFFNGSSMKERLFARYAYEHLFLAHLYFDDDPQRHFFKLVRSSTPPGEPLRQIATRRPVDDPGVARVWYRLVEERETVVAKTHMPYVLSAARMARWRELFFEPRYTVDKLPGYSAATAANPFATFADLPVGARYRFMLDEAAFTIMGFIKGPVCRGQMALDVIEDQFWVTFLAPDEGYDSATAALLKQDTNLLRLPTGSSNTGLLITWAHYAGLENAYLKSRSAFLSERLRGQQALDLHLIWDGDGHNDNAALTIFRHYDSASVVKGFVGASPKTAWVIGYPLLERIHYLLVADYDVYGNIGHQLNSRLYMDFLRMEGEFNFLTLLPESQRIAVRDQWYRGTGQASRGQVYGGPATTLNVETAIRYSTGDVKEELFTMMKSRLAPALQPLDDRPLLTSPAGREVVAAFAPIHGEALQWMPEIAMLAVDMPDGSVSTFSLLRNTGHASVSHLIGERLELLPKEDTLTVVPGVIGAYPNAFYRATLAEVPALVAAVGQLGSQGDYAAFSKRWAVRRTEPGFWAFSDAMLARYASDQPLEAGVLDYNRFENR